jgi:hypothetical protein
MVELSNGFHLSLEETSRFFGSLDTSMGAFVTKKLDSYLAVYVCIFRKVYFTHAATTDQANEPIPAKLQSYDRHLVTLRKLSNAYLCQINVLFHEQFSH